MFVNFTDPLSCLDFYKTGHHRQYPKGTTRIVSNMTPRASRIPDIDHVVFFGLQAYVLNWLHEGWGRFFRSDGEEQIDKYEDTVRVALNDPSYSANHLRDLHKLGYLPVEVRALKEGTRVPLRVPTYTIASTHPDFAWLPNFLESQMSAELWGMSTSATIADRYRAVFDGYAVNTGDLSFCEWQGHDFSMRGMWGVNAAAMSGAAHLLSFRGTDTVPAIHFAQQFYGAGPFVGGSVPATEHAIACSLATTNNAEDLLKGEFDAFLHLITKVHPTGIVSLVSDSYDFWGIVGAVLPALKDIIMARDGKVVIRPDSGDPVLILCGDPDSKDELARKGLVEYLWDIFGGTVNDRGFKVLDPHIGTIYGDSITMDRQGEILDCLTAKGFSSSNVVLGIGSYTYQHVTRDTFGWAIKATFAEVNGAAVPIYKKPKTDSGLKNSAKGLVFVTRNEAGELVAEENVSMEKFTSPENLLELVFVDGKVKRLQNFEDIRTSLAETRACRLWTKKPEEPIVRKRRQKTTPVVEQQPENSSPQA